MNVARIVGGSADFVDALGANAGLLGTSRQLNVVSDRAVAEGEFRYLTAAEGAAAGAELAGSRRRVASEHGVSMTFTAGAGIPPVDPHGPGAALARRVVELAAARGFRLEIEEDRGGVSFPNFLAEPGRIPVVDGLGPVGDGMHTRDEWLDLRLAGAPHRPLRGRPRGALIEGTMTDAAAPPERRIRMPHTLVIVGSLIVFVLVLSWVVPSGAYQTVEKAGRQVTIPGTYQRVAKVVLGPQWLMIAPIRGFLDGSLIIAFLLLIGGSFNVIQTTGIVELGIRKITAALASRPHLEKLMIPVLMTVFSLAGSVFGMAEEVIPFVLICVPLALSLGYDSIVGVSIPFLGAAAGFAAAFFNPFTVGLAQGLVGLPLYSGLGYRVDHVVRLHGRDRRVGDGLRRPGQAPARVEPRLRARPRARPERVRRGRAARAVDGAAPPRRRPLRRRHGRARLGDPAGRSGSSRRSARCSSRWAS